MTKPNQSVLELFIRGFLQIDTDNNELVDRQELIDYCRRENLDRSLVDDWIRKFDTDKDGRISLDEFCRGFGLKTDEMRIEKKEVNKELSGKSDALMPDIHIISSSMNINRQVQISEKFRQLIDRTNKSPDDLKQIATELKVYLDNTFGRVWHVVLLTGSYWMHFSHEPFQTMQFRYGPHICLVWRTPT